MSRAAAQVSLLPALQLAIPSTNKKPTKAQLIKIPRRRKKLPRTRVTTEACPQRFIKPESRGGHRALPEDQQQGSATCSECFRVGRQHKGRIKERHREGREAEVTRWWGRGAADLVPS